MPGPGVREAQADITRRAFAQGRAENAGFDVVVVVHLDEVLARSGPQDSSDVLDESAFERDRCGEEQGVEGRTVEALSDERPSGNDE